jgi:quinoprotein glucose dehydrogenase
MRGLAYVLVACLGLSGQELKLRQAWVYDTRDSLEAAKGGGKPPALEATPVYEAGRLYLSTPWGTVAALAMDSGKEIWRADLKVDPSGSYGDFANRGVTLAGDRLFTGTVDGRLACLMKSSGGACEGFGERGFIDLTKGLRRAPKYVGEYEVTSPPVVYRDLVITGSAIADNSRAEMASGEVRAFDVKTGAPRWTFHTLPESVKAGGANVWSRMAVDAESGMVFLPVGSASPDYYGGLRQGDNRHANSLVALRAATGELVWSFQTVHHDVWDYDVAAPPLLYEAGGRKAVAVGSKSGYLYLLDRMTGEPIFGVDEKPVPQSSVEGERTWATQPVPRKPAALAKQRYTEEDIWGPTPEEKQKCLETFRGLRHEGVFTPPSLGGSLVAPGNIGGMHWGGLAWARETGMLVTPVNQLPAIVHLIPAGKMRESAKAQPQRETTRQSGTSYAMSRQLFFSETLKPCVAPPWGVLAGVDAASGEIRWRVPLGELVNLGGVAIGRGGVAYVGADFTPFLRAFRTSDGKEIGKWPLPTSARATPAVVEHEGREYVVIAAGGHAAPLSKLDTKVVVFLVER